MAMFSALTAVTTAFTGQFFPSPTGGYTHVGDAVIFIASLMLGPKLGALVGAVGAVAADFYVGYPILGGLSLFRLMVSKGLSRV